MLAGCPAGDKPIVPHVLEKDGRVRVASMKSMKQAKTFYRIVTLSIFAALVLSGARLHAVSQQIRVQNGKDVIEIEVVDANILRVHVEPDGMTAPPTFVMDRAQDTSVPGSVELRADGAPIRTLTTPEMSVTVDDMQPLTLQVRDAKDRLLLTVKDPVAQARGGYVALIHDEYEELYGCADSTGRIAAKAFSALEAPSSRLAVRATTVHHSSLQGNTVS